MASTSSRIHSHNSQRTIALAGDSWGYCWTGRGPAGGTLPGIEHILTERGYTVVNLCSPGGTNSQAVSRLQRLAELPNYVVFIQTEPIRDFYTHESDPKHDWRRIVDAHRLIRLAEEHGGIAPAMDDFLITHTYRHLADWSSQTGVPVLVVGGCSRVPQSIPEPLTNLVPSWCQMLFGPDFQDSLFQDSCQWMSYEYAELVRKSKNAKLIKDWTHETKICLRKTAWWRNDSKYFNPCDWHPNYDAHKVLADRLEQYFVVDTQG